MKGYANARVGELASSPNVREIFERRGIDFCCGAHRTLREACAAAGVAVEHLIGEIEKAERPAAAAPVDWSHRPLSSLVRHVVEHLHVRARSEIDRLQELMVRVEGVHGRNRPELERIRCSFRKLREELLPHMENEEFILFPYIVAMETGSLGHQTLPPATFKTAEDPIHRMMHIERRIASELLAEIRQATSGYVAPPDACPSFRALYEGLGAFERDLVEHLRLENEILYPRAIELEKAMVQEPANDRRAPRSMLAGSLGAA